MRVLPAGELTFVFTDVEGSTRLLAALGSRYVELHGQHQALVRAAVARHDGIEVSTEGDSFFIVFRDAVAAALAAAEMSASIERNAWPEDGRVRIRIGIHSGRAVLAADDYVGIDVNRAARIAAAANGGQILLSGATAELVGDAAAAVASIRDLGRHRLRDVGVEQLFRLDPVGLAPNEASPRSLEAAPSNLPPPLRTLVDRTLERDRLADLLAEGRIVTVTGAGGIGKTALVLEVADGLRGRFLDGIGYIDVAAIDEVETAASLLAEGLRLPGDPARTASEALAEQLRGREVLLVIETADHLPGVGDLLADLVRSCPRIRVLVTSRAALHLQAEHELRLEPLADSASVELFVARARQSRPSFEPTAEDSAAIVDIIQRLDGLPLAIELAAARTGLLSPPQILERLLKQVPVLSAGAADAPSRQRTLRDTVDWSYRQLTEPERVLLQTIAALASDFELGAVEGLVLRALRDIDPSTVLDLLEGLVNKSLVDLRQDSSRFRLLTAIRDFGLEELSASGHRDATLRAHFDWILEMAEGVARAFDSAAPEDDLPLRSYEDDLRAALTWALETPDEAMAALNLAAAAGPFWYRLGRAREGSTWLERAIAAAPIGRETVHGDAHYWAGVLADERRQLERAVAHLELSLEIRRERGEDAAITRTINSLGVVSRSAGDLARARILLSESLERKRAANDPRVGSTITNLAIVAVDEGKLDEALGLFEEALESDRHAGLSEPHPAVLLGIAAVHVRSGEPVRSIEPALIAARRFAALEDNIAVAECLEVLVEAWQDAQPRTAVVLLSASDAIRAAEGIQRDQADEKRLEAIGVAIRSRLSADEMGPLVAEGRALNASAALAYAEAMAGRAELERYSGATTNRL